MEKEIISLTLNQALEEGRKYTVEGDVATYIPELGKVDKNLLGATIITNEGNSYNVGDFEYEFTIQSISKTIALIFALERFGQERVFKKAGMEASGEPFNSIVRLETKDIKPSNPFINAGAIAITSLIGQKYVFEDFLEFVRNICGRDSIELDENVFISEKKTGHRNRSLAYMMKNSGIIENEVDEVLDFYFKMCAIKVNTTDLAQYAVVLANNGKMPNSKIQLVDNSTLRIVKSLMVVCGMYDGSGEFFLNVGMPAKSGVGGGIVACSQGKMGIAVFGPSLDTRGNSIGGVKILEYLSEKLNLHQFS